MPRRCGNGCPLELRRKRKMYRSSPAVSYSTISTGVLPIRAFTRSYRGGGRGGDRATYRTLFSNKRSAFEVGGPVVHEFFCAISKSTTFFVCQARFLLEIFCYCCRKLTQAWFRLVRFYVGKKRNLCPFFPEIVVCLLFAIFHDTARLH